MPAAEVKCAGVSYFVEQEVPGVDKPLRVRREARFGDVIDNLPKAEFDRLVDLEAVQKPGSAPLRSGVAVRTPFTTGVAVPGNLDAAVEAVPSVPVAAVSFNVAAANDEALIEHIKANKLSIKDTVVLAGDDPVLAERILAADTVAQGDQPRSGVSKALAKIGPAPVAFKASEASDEELAAHVRDGRLDVDATVALAADDPDLAIRILAAEQEVTDGEPRQGVVDGLEKLSA